MLLNEKYLAQFERNSGLKKGTVGLKNHLFETYMQDARDNGSAYQFFLVMDLNGEAKIIDGSDYRQDAIDAMNKYLGSDIRLKVYSLVYLKGEGINPEDDSNWGNQRDIDMAMNASNQDGGIMNENLDNTFASRNSRGQDSDPNREYSRDDMSKHVNRLQQARSGPVNGSRASMASNQNVAAASRKAAVENPGSQSTFRNQTNAETAKSLLNKNAQDRKQMNGYGPMDTSNATYDSGSYRRQLPEGEAMPDSEMDDFFSTSEEPDQLGIDNQQSLDYDEPENDKDAESQDDYHLNENRADAARGQNYATSYRTKSQELNRGPEHKKGYTGLAKKSVADSNKNRLHQSASSQSLSENNGISNSLNESSRALYKKAGVDESEYARFLRNAGIKVKVLKEGYAAVPTQQDVDDFQASEYEGNDEPENNKDSESQDDYHLNEDGGLLETYADSLKNTMDFINSQEDEADTKGVENTNPEASPEISVKKAIPPLSGSSFGYGSRPISDIADLVERIVDKSSIYLENRGNFRGGCEKVNDNTVKGVYLSNKVGQYKVRVEVSVTNDYYYIKDKIPSFTNTEGPLMEYNMSIPGSDKKSYFRMFYDNRAYGKRELDAYLEDLLSTLRGWKKQDDEEG